MTRTTLCATKVLISLLALLASGAAIGQNSGPNLIGIYFDPDLRVNCGVAHPYTTLTAYVLAMDVSEPSGLAGWELSLLTEPATLPFPLHVTIENGGTNALADPDYEVFLPAVMPQSRIIRLASFRMFYVGGEVSFGIGPAHPGHFPASPGPGYAAGDDSTRWIRLHVPCALGLASRPDSYIVATTGGCPLLDDNWCITPVEADSWGAVKALYR
jgi:hypothetical protein